MLRTARQPREDLQEGQVTGRYGIAVVGTSWGGLAALRELVSSLPNDLGMPVVLIQHRHKMSDDALPRLLQDRTALHVCEAEDKMPIEAGHVYVAPADYHLLIESDLYFELSVDEALKRGNNFFK